MTRVHVTFDEESEVTVEEAEAMVEEFVSGREEFQDASVRGLGGQAVEVVVEFFADDSDSVGVMKRELWFETDAIHNIRVV